MMQCPLPISQHSTVQLGHGSGGKMMHDLIEKLIVWAFDNPALRRLDDQAVLEIANARLAFSTDSYVIDPIFFPGGNIGELAVNGTINDVCMSGARPLFLSCGLIIEEGMSLDELRIIVESMRDTAQQAGVQIVTGDTKVVNKGKGDKLFINTTGIGVIEHGWQFGAQHICPGDAVILSGSLADHGIAILSKREGIQFETPITSDTAALHGLVAHMLATAGGSIRAMRDPTRGGLASTLNEFAQAAKIGIRIAEARVPIEPAVAGACEMLGLDPLHVANEGKLVVIAAREQAGELVAAMREHDLGRSAAIIGDVTNDTPGLVSVKTKIGSWRILDMLAGEQLPRIC